MSTIFKEPVDLLESSDSDAPIIKFVNNVIFRAIKDKASDIHIEPCRKRAWPCAFVLTVCSTILCAHLKNSTPENSSRIKLMGELDIAEKRCLKTAVLKLKLREKRGYSVSPSCPRHMESVWFYVFDKSHVRLDLQDLGFDEKAIALIDQIVHPQKTRDFISHRSHG